MATITIDIPDELMAQFKSMDEIRRTVFEDFIIEQRQSGKISMGQAAELLGISYTDFFELVGKKGLSFINANQQEIDQSYHQYETVLNQNIS